ncbi:MAG TPA: hypothetical protein VKY85_28560 [Candidatus Angelobacter sp.]|nr:hypothetical protein [Candidatus Angelobacter sp.]
MPNNNGNRVLSRANARHLSAEELQKILGKGDAVVTHFTSPLFGDS